VIIPIAFHIQHKVPEEEYSNNLGYTFSAPQASRYCIEANLLDSESGQVLSYVFHSMVDGTKDPGENVGHRESRPVTHRDVTNLRQVRDEINKLLGETETLEGLRAENAIMRAALEGQDG
jgi:hypothetical protein